MVQPLFLDPASGEQRRASSAYRLDDITLPVTVVLEDP